jgi:hypothetical protein
MADQRQGHDAAAGHSRKALSQAEQPVAIREETPSRLTLMSRLR